MTGGAAYCWGRGEIGRLGNGSMTDQETPVAVTRGNLSGGASAVPESH